MQIKAGGLLLACALLLTAVPNARAAEDTPTPTPSTQVIAPEIPVESPLDPSYEPYQGGSSGQEIEITGRIKPRIISAIVTCQMDFRMTPGTERDISLGDGNDLTLTEIAYPETAAVTNMSTVPIQVSVAEVKTENFKINGAAPQNGETLTLTDELTKTTDPYTVLLVLGTRGETFADLAAFEGQALMAGSNEVAIIKSLPVADTETPGDNVKNFQIFGKTADAVAEPYSFTVITTLRIAPAKRAEGGP